MAWQRLVAGTQQMQQSCCTTSWLSVLLTIFDLLNLSSQVEISSGDTRLQATIESITECKRTHGLLLGPNEGQPGTAMPCQRQESLPFGQIYVAFVFVHTQNHNWLLTSNLKPKCPSISTAIRTDSKQVFQPVRQSIP